MAPNTKQLSRIVQHLSNSDLTISKTAFLPLTQDTKLGETPETLEKYWDWDNECIKQDSDSFWEWPANPEERVLSTDHIVSNLIKSDVQKSKSKSVQSIIDSSDYWDGRCVKDREDVKEVCGESSDNYWNWNYESQGISQEALPLHVPQNYWDWKNEAEKSDSYWAWPLQANTSLITMKIEENLLKISSQSGDLIRSGMDSFDYWDDRSAKDREFNIPQPLSDLVSDVYWEWSPSADNTKRVVSILEDANVHGCQQGAY